MLVCEFSALSTICQNSSDEFCFRAYNDQATPELHTNLVIGTAYHNIIVVNTFTGCRLAIGKYELGS